VALKPGVNHISHYYYYYVALGLELRAFTLSHSTSQIFCDGFFELGFHELFAWADFKL
jgi:hypothetical protein